MRSRSSLCPRALPPVRRPRGLAVCPLLAAVSGDAETFYAAAVLVACLGPPSAVGGAVVDSVCPLCAPLAFQRTTKRIDLQPMMPRDVTVCCQWPLPNRATAERFGDGGVAWVVGFGFGVGGGDGSCYLC